MKIEFVGFSRKYHQLKAWVMPSRQSAHSFLIFWVFLVENLVSMFSKKITWVIYSWKKILKKWKFRIYFWIFFFNTFMLSECSLAMSCYFYIPKYPKKSTTATPLTIQNQPTQFCAIIWENMKCVSEAAWFWIETFPMGSSHQLNLRIPSKLF